MTQDSGNVTPAEGQTGSATPVAPDPSDAAAPSPTASDLAISGPTTTSSERSKLHELDAALRSDSPHPMAKSMLASSDPAAAAKASLAADTAAPYGTRSRNRTGTSRPNYAEDKDADAEMYDDSPDQRTSEAKKSSRHTNPPANSSQEAHRTNGPSRKLAGGDDDKANALPPGLKETTASNGAPLNSLANSSSGAQPSKKRKAAAQSSGSASSSHTPVPSSSSATTAHSRRSAATAPAAANMYPETNMFTFDNCKARLKDGALLADDGTVLRPNDNVYLVCEPPGEPYYLGRIMEFLHAQNDPSKPIDAFRINWFYRPKDIGKKVNDTRLVFATMHSDISPLTSLRGKCQIKHKAEIKNMDEFRKTPDSFWYEKLYDRYIQKNYDLIPTQQIVNVPEKVKQVLDERWKFIIVEQGRGKELTSAVKLCRRCSGYCASNDSVDCAVCKNTYHMNCVRPPLLKKPSRGFAWSCAACSRAQERKLEARHTPNVAEPSGEADEDEIYDDEDEEMQGLDTGRTSPTDDDKSHHTGTAEQIYQASLWPWRYLGMHCKPEDALDYDDRIYPRASTRVGPRHQATVLPWPGRPVEYLEPLDFKKPGKKDPKAKEAQAAFEAEKARREKLPKWVQERPTGYVARGEDDEEDHNESKGSCATATLLWRPPPAVKKDQEVVVEAQIDDYMIQTEKMAPKFDLPAKSTNLKDVAVQTYFDAGYSEERALDALSKTKKTAFGEPDLSPAELKRFEEAVSRYGSELQLVTRHVKTVPYGSIVRYYYVWKKSKQGKLVWGNFHNRKGKKEAKKAEAAANKLQDDIADDADDSAFDMDKAIDKKKGFICKFCQTKSSRQWRRAPNVSSAVISENGGKNATKDKGTQYVQALCRRCAELWRRYAIQWEDLEEVAKKVAQAGGRAWKRKQDEELLKELLTANELLSIYGTPEPTNPPNGAATAAAPGTTTGEPPRKKLKSLPDRDSDQAGSDSGTAQSKRKEKVEKPPPPVPDIPKPKTMPCAICNEVEPLQDQQHLSCKECRLTVHRSCYGVADNRSVGKWTCDMCFNDKNPQVSIHYKCVLCPVEHTEHDFVEAPKPSTSKKKTEKDKERERSEREKAEKAAEYYKKKQEEMNRPVNPREPLKRTADNNWVHVTCAVWTPEVKFGNSRTLAPSEGIPSIPRGRYDEVCKACGHKGGACVSCHHCKASVHIECARQRGYLIGFDITPVKGSRRDQHNIVTINGESGAMSATVWCKEHVPTKTIVHRMHDVVNDNGQNALQLYVQTCKQADLGLTGTVRKANLMANAAKNSAAPSATGARRASTTQLTSGFPGLSGHHELPPAQNLGDKLCITCGVDVSPRWWPIDTSDERELTNGHYGMLGSEAQKFIEQRKFQCHKCRKARRKPNPHTFKEESPAADSNRQGPLSLPLASAPLAAPALKSPPLLASSETRGSSLSYPWAAAAPAGAMALHHPSSTGPLPVTPTAPPAQASAPPSHAPPPGPAPTYGSSGPRYPEWHSRHGSPPRQTNGGPPPIQPATLGNLSALRPPPMAVPGPAQMSPAGPNVHQVPPMSNGPPPSPRRLEGHVALPHTAPYMSAYHNSLPHAVSNGAPARVSEAFSHGLMPQRPPFPNPAGSPPAVQDNRETPGPSGGSSMMLADPPRAAGASTSPSLRNLLS